MSVKAYGNDDINVEKKPIFLGVKDYFDLRGGRVIRIK